MHYSNPSAATSPPHAPRPLATDSSKTPATRKSVAVAARQPFPVDSLPATLRDYVAAAAAAIGCDPSFIALPLLTCLARAIGNKRVVRLKASWTEPAIIWAAIIGKSGTHKTPALKAATQFFVPAETEEFARFAEAAAQYEQDTKCYEKEYQLWMRTKDIAVPPPTRPEPPVCERFTTSDVTIEALAAILDAQFDGVLVIRDELAGWMGGMAEYKGGKGSDLGHWLAMWSGAPLTVDRKTGAKKTIRVPRAAVSLVGGIQPDVLRSAIGREHLHDGLCQRLLLTMPSPALVQWSEAIVPQAVEQAMADVFAELLTLEPGADADGNLEPVPLDLTPQAKAIWVPYFNRHRRELTACDDDLAAAWCKLEAYTARFALIFQLCDWASGNAGCDAIDEAAMQSAIALSDWFCGEARRVYELFTETDDERENREMVEWIRRAGGAVSVRDVTRGPQRYRGNPKEAEAALKRLVELEIGTWEVESTATNQKRVFRLATATDLSISLDSSKSVAIGIGNGSATPSDQVEVA